LRNFVCQLYGVHGALACHISACNAK
jgi:hypothetical protein